jgi:hypothetical protein
MTKRRRPGALRETQPAEWHSRRLALVAIGLLAVLVIVAFLRARRDKPPPEAAAPQQEETQVPSPVERAPTRAESPPAPAPRTDVPPDPPPVIDSITLEKQSVCAGEENLVTVKAHTTNGTDDYLHTVIDGSMGSSFPVRLWRNDKGQVNGQHVVTVFGRGNVATTVPLPSYEVRDCQPPRIVGIEPRVRSNSWSDFDFLAKVVAPLPPPSRTGADAGAAPPAPFVPKTFVWSFGDGETATTTTPFVEHNYEGRAQTALYSYFSISVEVRPKEGDPVTGRTTLALINPAWEAFALKGVVTLMIALTPRFPEIGSDGRVTQRVRLWHTDSAPVTIEQARATKFYVGGVGQAPAQPVDVSGLLGTTTIPAGKDGITTTVVLDAAGEPEVQTITYELAGKSRDGHPVAGSFSVMQPPPKLTADNTQPLLDPFLKAKVIAARQILHQDVVNDEDLWRLEREGKFANLPVPTTTGSSAPPPNDPQRVTPPGRGSEVPAKQSTPNAPPLGPDTVPRAKNR